MAEKDAGAEKSVLLVLAHPALERSRANRAMARAAAEVPGVSLLDLYETYPDYLIDVAAEQARLKAHAIIVLQFPLYWYSTPALLKEWIDAVWLYGFAYGQKGHAMDGKTLFVACSAGSPVSDYQDGGSHRYSMSEFLRPLERTAALCRMAWEDPFILHESRLRDSDSLSQATETYRARLAALASAATPGPPNQASSGIQP